MWVFRYVWTSKIKTKIRTFLVVSCSTVEPKVEQSTVGVMKNNIIENYYLTNSPKRFLSDSMEVEPQEPLTRLDLPEEIWINIFRRLDIKSVQSSQLVCKKWLDFILNDVILSGEYRFSGDLLSPQINGILAKRKKLKTVRFPHPYEYRVCHSKLYFLNIL